MTVPQVAPARADQMIDSVQLAATVNGFHLEPRCRVCRNDHLRKKVNDMLASGVSYAMILRALKDDNTKLDKRDRVTIDSIRNHTARHFPVQNVARATEATMNPGRGPRWSKLRTGSKSLECPSTRSALPRATSIPQSSVI